MKDSSKNKLHFFRKKIEISSFLLVNLIISLIVIILRINKGDTFVQAFGFLIEKIYLDLLFRQPAIFLGLITLVGYLALKKGIVVALIGALKTALGFIVLSIGSGVLIDIARPIFLGIKDLGGTSVVPLDPYFGWISANSFLQEGISISNSYLSLVTYVFLLAFVVNVILVVLKRWTNIHSLMITGHIMFQQAAIVTAFTYVFLFRDFSLAGESLSAGVQVGLVAVSSIFLGIYWAVASTLTIAPTEKLTKGGGFSVGHQQMLSVALAYKLGKYLGNPENSAEDRKKMPKWIKVFEDNIFSQTIILLVLFSILITILFVATYSQENSIIVFNGKNYVFSKAYNSWNVFGDSHPILNILGGSIKIVGSILVILTGVRLFVAELQQAFQGISEKIIPGAIPAIDIAASFGFSPNSLTLGFISGTIAQYLGVGFVILISKVTNHNLVISVPLFITLFFNSGALGVFANVSGGWKAAIIAPAIIGFLEILLSSLALTQIQNIFNQGISPIEKGYIGMSDWNIFYGMVTIFSSFNRVGAWILYVSIILGALVGAQFIKTNIQKNK